VLVASYFRGRILPLSHPDFRDLSHATADVSRVSQAPRWNFSASVSARTASACSARW
jgi:hypothetical protein